jgi:adenine-specific DNA-methyltransferase
MSYVFLLGVLNSRVTQYVFATLNPQMVGKVFAEIKVVYVERLPIPVATQSEQKPVERLVERILATKQRQAEANVTALEQEVDELVYALYGLTAAERAIVEAETATD